MTCPRFTLRTLLVWVAAGATLLLAYSWLPNRVTDDELETVRGGMTEQQVQELLGTPDRIMDLGESHLWHYGGDTLIHFRNGKVAYSERF